MLGSGSLTPRQARRSGDAGRERVTRDCDADLRRRDEPNPDLATMAVAGCTRCIKYMLFFFNFIFWVSLSDPALFTFETLDSRSAGFFGDAIVSLCEEDRELPGLWVSHGAVASLGSGREVQNLAFLVGGKTEVRTEDMQWRLQPPCRPVDSFKPPPHSEQEEDVSHHWHPKLSCVFLGISCYFKMSCPPPNPPKPPRSCRTRRVRRLIEFLGEGRAVSL